MTPRQREALTALKRSGGNVSQAARDIGMKRSNFQQLVAKAKRYEELDRGDFTTITPPEKDIPPEELWSIKRDKFRARQEYEDAVTWRPYRMKSNTPIGLLWFGDPHLDDDGCDVDALDHAVEIGNLPGVYSIGIGDYSNNWVGRLARLYESQMTTKAQAVKLMEWFITGRGLKWLTLVKGNHDMWSGKHDPLDWIANGVSDIAEWRAQFVIEFPNGYAVPVDAAHDFKGHSQYAENFGAKKAALFDGRASIYVCGHKHCYGVDRFLHKERGTLHEAMRARGFKKFDSYALTGGFAQHDGGEALLTIVDPVSGWFQTFDNLDAGAKLLNALRDE